MEVRLRRLQKKDASLMLEWMHDSKIQECFRKNMIGATLQDAVRFCEKAEIPESPSQGDDIHYAIADENDEYMGTISLKNVDIYNKTAEYALAVRRKAQGKGVACMATQLILEEAFSRYKMHRVYLNVLVSNIPAIKLYEKSGFTCEGEFREHILKENQYINLRWYAMLEDSYRQMKAGKDVKNRTDIKLGGVNCKFILICISIPHNEDWMCYSMKPLLYKECA